MASLTLNNSGGGGKSKQGAGGNQAGKQQNPQQRRARVLSTPSPSTTSSSTVTAGTTQQQNVITGTELLELLLSYSSGNGNEDMEADLVRGALGVKCCEMLCGIGVVERVDGGSSTSFEVRLFSCKHYMHRTALQFICRFCDSTTANGHVQVGSWSKRELLTSTSAAKSQWFAGRAERWQVKQCCVLRGTAIISG